ncbi:bZIP transcription factor, partial [candidate division KSB1 bacterium]|nr:bZIP transcription factor [Phycisphaerae bacterium]NIR49723.1 bZIP transcription factor [candidate division KSB1 bacterium]NIS25161.1 bZIP transcription factor [candidate division KSB1 bacterium]NIT72070.1 bZIP transcription factor [candidate division KSB1 bacterium]NIU25864.1 bZIP transcription factor [candidate division KSB1 bacterium]
MAIFEKSRLKIISGKGDADLSRASVNEDLSAVGYDTDGKFFYITMDKVLFSDPASLIKTVLDAHGFVPNLENILACLDSFTFAVYARTSNKGDNDATISRVNEYFPGIRFELPQKNKIGKILQSFYDELAKYESQSSGNNNATWMPDPEVKKAKDLKAQVTELQQENKELQEQVSALT